MNYFEKNLRNGIALASIGKLIRPYTSGVRVVLLIFILMANTERGGSGDQRKTSGQ